MDNQNQYQQAYYQPQYAQQGPPPPKPDNHLVWAILSTLFCCLPLGIISIVYASKVDSQYSAGDYAGAQDSANKAKNFAIWAAISIVIITILAASLGILGDLLDSM